jgi:branched-chain amino acid transport system permease protein
MVPEFSQRYIIAGVISVGMTILLINWMAFGYFAAARSYSHASWLKVIYASLAGLIISGILAILVLLIENFNLQVVLVYASPQLVEVLTFNQGVIPGIYYLLGAGLIAGAAGGLIEILPGRIRHAVTLGLTGVALIGLLQQLIQVTLSPFEFIIRATGFMFGSKVQTGLSPLGAATVFLLVAGIDYLWASFGPKVQTRVQALPPSGRKNLRRGSLIALGLLVLYLPALLGVYLSEVSNQIGLFILMALGLNIVVGFAGLLDLGYVAFYALGAYTVGVLTTTGGEIVFAPQLSFWVALPIAVFVAVMAGIILGVPVLKMRGDYLAIVTLGFGEIIRILALSDWLKPYIGGSQGIVSIPPPQIGNLTLNTPQSLYYLVVAGILVALFIAIRLRDSRLGRTWKALREDEDVAQAMGVNLVVTKLLAFATGAALAGLAGAILAPKLGTIYPHSFALLISINVLAVIIVGGMGSVPGVFVGALILVGMPELLREFAEYRLMIYGALLVIMMQVRPAGFWPEATHKRELQLDNNPATVSDTEGNV